MFQKILRSVAHEVLGIGKVGKRRRRAQPANTTTAECESLEQRRVLSATASLQQGVLNIVGSNGNDQIYVRQINNRITIDGVNGSLAASQVRAINIVAGAGNDEVILLNSQLQRGAQDIRIPTRIDAGSGNDLVTGGTSFDFLIGGNGNDSLYGTDGDDLLVGGLGDDFLHGGTGNDYLFGQGGMDSLNGSDGSDYLDGGDNADYLNGGSGNDALVGGYGYDYLAGGSGTNYIVDTYRYIEPNASGRDLVLNSQTVPTAYRPTLSYQPTTALQSILGADLYNAIVVDRRIPTSIGNPPLA